MSWSIEIVVAVANRNVIGLKGEMPWGHLQRDLEHFKQLTMGHFVIVGFNTLQSIAKMQGRHSNLLPGRKLYVLTRDPSKLLFYPECIGIPDIESVLKLGERGRVFVAGGQEIYQQFLLLPQTHIVHMTRIFADYYGDAIFPKLECGEWETAKSEFHSPDQNNKHAMRFTTYRRISHM